MMRNNLTRYCVVAVVVGAFLFSTSINAQNNQPQQPNAPQEMQKTPLRIVNTNNFCSQLTDSFKHLGKQRGFSDKKSYILASLATTRLVDEMRLGRATDFVNTAALGDLTAPSQDFRPAFLQLTMLLANAMDINGTVVNLALSAGELRFIPHVQMGSHIIVLAQHAAALTPERAKAVTDIALKGKIKISVVWLGDSVTHETPEEQHKIHEAKALGFLATVTGGVFLDLSGKDNPCSTLL